MNLSESYLQSAAQLRRIAASLENDERSRELLTAAGEYETRAAGIEQTSAARSATLQRKLALPSKRRRAPLEL